MTQTLKSFFFQVNREIKQKSVHKWATRVIKHQINQTNASASALAIAILK